MTLFSIKKNLNLKFEATDVKSKLDWVPAVYNERRSHYERINFYTEKKPASFKKSIKSGLLQGGLANNLQQVCG